MKNHIANAVTGIRILGSILLIFVPIFSILFYVVYLICGLSDMIDGAIARKNDSVSSFGARLDTIADIMFTTVILAKLLMNIPIPGWLWLWIVAIALIKAVNIGLGFVQGKGLVSIHSVMNKVTGLAPLKLNSFGSVTLGMMFILMSLLCRYGAEQHEENKTACNL